MSKDMPKDFAAVLKEAGLAGFFAECTGPHQNEYLKWIGEAKKPETRQKRIAQATKLIAATQAEELTRAKRRQKP